MSAGLSPALERIPLRDRDGKLGPITLQQAVQGVQIRADHSHSAFFLQVAGKRSFTDSLHAHLAAGYFVQHAHGRPEHVLDPQQPVAVIFASFFNLPGRVEFVLAAEQGGIAHLRQVKLDRIGRTSVHHGLLVPKRAKEGELP